MPDVSIPGEPAGAGRVEAKRGRQQRGFPRAPWPDSIHLPAGRRPRARGVTQQVDAMHDQHRRRFLERSLDLGAGHGDGPQLSDEPTDHHWQPPGVGLGEQVVGFARPPRRVPRSADTPTRAASGARPRSPAALHQCGQGRIQRGLESPLRAVVVFARTWRLSQRGFGEPHMVDPGPPVHHDDLGGQDQPEPVHHGIPPPEQPALIGRVPGGWGERNASRDGKAVPPSELQPLPGVGLAGVTRLDRGCDLGFVDQGRRVRRCHYEQPTARRPILGAGSSALHKGRVDVVGRLAGGLVCAGV